MTAHESNHWCKGREKNRGLGKQRKHSKIVLIIGITITCRAVCEEKIEWYKPSSFMINGSKSQLLGFSCDARTHSFRLLRGKTKNKQQIPRPRHLIGPILERTCVFNLLKDELRG